MCSVWIFLSCWFIVVIVSHCWSDLWCAFFKCFFFLLLLLRHTFRVYAQHRKTKWSQSERSFVRSHTTSANARVKCCWCVCVRFFFSLFSPCLALTTRFFKWAEKRKKNKIYYIFRHFVRQESSSVLSYLITSSCLSCTRSFIQTKRAKRKYVCPHVLLQNGLLNENARILKCLHYQNEYTSISYLLDSLIFIQNVAHTGWIQQL